MKSPDGDSGKIISLSKARKSRTRQEKEQRASENRIRHGRTGAQKKADKLEKSRQSKRHDNNELTDK